MFVGRTQEILANNFSVIVMVRTCQGEVFADDRLHVAWTRVFCAVIDSSIAKSISSNACQICQLYLLTANDQRVRGGFVRGDGDVIWHENLGLATQQGFRN